MNPFDILARNLPRPVDSHSPREQAVTFESADGNVAPADVKSFDALLKGFSEQASGDEANTQWIGELGQLDIKLTEDTPEMEDSGVAGAVFALLQGMLPNATSQTTAAPITVRNEQMGEPSPQSLVEGILPSQEEDGLLGLRPEPKLLVTVQQQETHFKPVIEGLETGLVSEPQGDAESLSETGFTLEPLNKLSIPARDNRQNTSTLSHPRTSSPAMPSKVTEPTSDYSSNTLVASEQLASHPENGADAQKDVSLQSAKQDGVTSLPSEALQRIANAVRTEAQALDSAQTHSTQPNEALRTMSIKASESALRVLNLQLHPAHLGAVTIKMRLAGESLEMELHVEREETAQLLKTDSEKLSSLLRGSGYRPDVISIHVNDAVAQDRGAPPRSQSDPQMQGQSFQQGGAGQDDRSRNREKQYDSARAEHQNHADEKAILGSRSTGGVYL